MPNLISKRQRLNYAHNGRPELTCKEPGCHGTVEIYAHELAYCFKCKTEYYVQRSGENIWSMKKIVINNRLEEIDY